MPASPASVDTRATSASPSPLLRPRAWLRARFAHWWQARLPLSDQLTLTQRNIYILPTGAGWMLALTLLVLLVAAINFQLNLGYLLTFLIAGSAIAGMHVCHATLRGLSSDLGHQMRDYVHDARTRTATFAVRRGLEPSRRLYALALEMERLAIGVLLGWLVWKIPTLVLFGVQMPFSCCCGRRPGGRGGHTGPECWPTMTPTTKAASKAGATRCTGSITACRR